MASGAARRADGSAGRPRTRWLSILLVGNQSAAGFTPRARLGAGVNWTTTHRPFIQNIPANNFIFVDSTNMKFYICIMTKKPAYDDRILSRGQFALLGGFLKADRGEGATTSQAILVMSSVNEEISLPQASAVRARLEKAGWLDRSVLGRRSFSVTPSGCDALKATAIHFIQLSSLALDLVPKAARKSLFEGLSNGS